jgi:hypothetical protein
MLRIEKNAQHVKICVKEQDKFWSPTLLTALGLAFGIHLCAFLLFQIQAFKLTSTFIFSPLDVQMQESAPNSSLLTVLESEVHTEEFPWLSFYNPAPPQVPTSLLQNEALENVPHLISSLAILPHVSSAAIYKPLQIVLKGHLMERQIVSFPLIEDKLVREGTMHTMGYRVQIDPESGLVIWYDQIHSSSQSTIDRIAEDILLNLQFVTGDPFKALTGEIHLTFDPNYRNHSYD